MQCTVHSARSALCWANASRSTERELSRLFGNIMEAFSALPRKRRTTAKVLLRLVRLAPDRFPAAEWGQKAAGERQTPPLQAEVWPAGAKNSSPITTTTTTIISSVSRFPPRISGQAQAGPSWPAARADLASSGLTSGKDGAIGEQLASAAAFGARSFTYDDAQLCAQWTLEGADRARAGQAQQRAASSQQPAGDWPAFKWSGWLVEECPLLHSSNPPPHPFGSILACSAQTAAHTTGRSSPTPLAIILHLRPTLAPPLSLALSH